ncbi:unnamed protein product [Spirodela intermedia]|uniref:Uncharacterized protein n=1 Tax=Spirodela intermedia TaxID=51605 RepID=A0A7I8JX84_SPIIN|nr:unnamed protein product [Spirodela intermedia]
MYRFFRPERPERKTIHLPSGEQEGNALFPASVLVRIFSSEGTRSPSAT